MWSSTWDCLWAGLPGGGRGRVVRGTYAVRAGGAGARENDGVARGRAGAAGATGLEAAGAAGSSYLLAVLLPLLASWRLL